MKQTLMHSLTSVFEFTPKCLWIHTSVSLISYPIFKHCPASSISISQNRDSIKMLKCFMIQNATKFCIWGAQILKTLSLSLSLIIKKREKIKSPTKPHPKKPMIKKVMFMIRCTHCILYTITLDPRGLRIEGKKFFREVVPESGF